MSRIGIMQGRLSPPEVGRFQAFPRATWADEFGAARSAGLDTIEWIYDEYGEDRNPISGGAGLEEMKRLQTETGVAVVSVCADYFLDLPLLRCGESERAERRDRLFWMIDRSRDLRIERVVLPFVDASEIRATSEQRELVPILREAAAAARENAIELHIESSLGPSRFAGFLEELDHPAIRVNYDSGNSAALGFAPEEEFRAYGELVGSVHVKDRLRAGGTVPLGSGDADFGALFQCLGKRGYDGDFVLQAARGDPGGEVELARENRAFVLGLLAGQG
jgi:L-ribulose-5-phosphate 3-epimerase